MAAQEEKAGRITFARTNSAHTTAHLAEQDGQNDRADRHLDACARIDNAG